jgi:hypothetical protein
MTLRITICNRYVDLGWGMFGIAGYGRYVVGRYCIFALEIER